MKAPQPDFAQRIDARVEGHVLVVGVGGIGCPAGWGLRASGVERITLVDPDVVELSNLPRQVLFTEAHLGHAKAEIAADRLGGAPAGVVGVHARLDHETAGRLLQGVDLLIDATDGARTKDWLNQLAVRRGLPLAHAAGLRSEGRLLPVPAGGRPCLACLFGRLEAETGSCADLGVWNGVVGTVGFLAAHAAAQWLRTSSPPAPAYTVLDFEARSGFALAVRTADACPVCAAREAAPEPYPIEADCAVEPRVADDADVDPDATLDLREERCPMNLLRARKALEQAAPGHVLAIELGEEGAATVPDGVRALGHTVLAAAPSDASGLRLLVRRGPGRREPAAFDDEALRRFARQLVLPDVGARGQARLCAAQVVVSAEPGPGRDAAVVYLRAAGVLATAGGADGSPHALSVGDGSAALRMARAAAWADALQRSIVQEAPMGTPLAIGVDGSV